MKCLIIIDRLNWAYHSIAKAIKKYNTRDVSFSIMSVKSDLEKIKTKFFRFDRIHLMGWQNYYDVNFIEQGILSTGIHSFHSWDNKKTTPDFFCNPPKKILKLLSKFRALNAVSSRLTNIFLKNGINTIYTPNGVDTDIFKKNKNTPIGKNIIIGYSGTLSHDWRKGITEYILPAAKKSGVEAKLAMLRNDNYIPLEDMHNFYNSIDCYVCASLSEGMSLSVLEAGACGCPVIGTRISGNEEIIEDGKNGFFVSRNVDDISDKINRLKVPSVLQKMSANMYEDINKKWAWSIQSKKWIEFITSSA